MALVVAGAIGAEAVAIGAELGAGLLWLLQWAVPPRLGQYRGVTPGRN